MSKRCPNCGVELEDNALFCDECGTQLTQSAALPTSQAAELSNINLQSTSTLSPTDDMKNSGLGIAAMVCGIISLCTLGIFFLPEIIGLVLGIIAMGNKSKKHNFAVVGIVTSAIAFVLVIVILLIPSTDNIEAELINMETLDATDELIDEDDEIPEEISAKAKTDEVQSVIPETQNEQKDEPDVVQFDYRYISSIQASSELTDSTKTYRVEAVLDGNKETCWSEGTDGIGVGEVITINFTRPVYISEVAFLNGYMKNETVYNANGKLKRVELGFEGEKYEAEFDDLQYHEVENTLYSDRFALDAPVRTQFLSIMILDAQKGSKYDDICLTDLAIWGYADDTDGANVPDIVLPAASYSWMKGGNEDAYGADITVLYESDGKIRMTGECWNSVEVVKIDAVAVAVDANGSLQFVGDVWLSEPGFSESDEKLIGNVVLSVSPMRQNEIQIKQGGEIGGVTSSFSGTYQAAGGEETFDIYDVYRNVIYEVAMMYGSDCEYALYDLDHDGTVELITSQGTSDVDWFNTVYTVDDSGMPVEVGSFYGLVSLYAAETGNGIYSVYGHMGYQQVEWIVKNGDELYTEIILSEETEDYYENDNPIKMVGIDEDIEDY